MRLFAYLRCTSALWLLVAVVPLNSMAQNIGETPKVALQPLAQHVRQVQEALSFLGKLVSFRPDVPSRIGNSSPDYCLAPDIAS